MSARGRRTRAPEGARSGDGPGDDGREGFEEESEPEGSGDACAEEYDEEGCDDASESEDVSGKPSSVIMLHPFRHSSRRLCEVRRSC